MVGHSFGLVSSVYNYNRRSAAITDILRRLFFVAAFNFYDDKYGFEPGQTIESAFQCAQKVHWWLGARFDAKKLQMSSAPTILGVTYDLEGMRLLIKQKRKEEIIDEIDSIMSSGILPPGQAGKLRGKLMFGASQLWGKVGRAFLRALSERQYSNFSSVKVNSAISRSLVEWKFLLESGPPRPIEAVDAVVFTDGSFPDGKEGAPLKPWIGGVIFIRGSRPVQFGCEVKKDLIDKWIPRKSQIAMVELFATIAALETFKSQLEGSSTLLFVDSEPVQGALVKGYSAREDMCELVSVFWRCALVLKINLYIDRISTDANPADHPSRNRMEVGESLGWIEIEPKFPFLQRGLVETFGSWCFSLLLHLVFYSLDVQKLFHFGLDPELIANQLVRIFSFGPDHKARQEPQMWGFKPLIYPRRLRGKRFFARSVARCRPVDQHVFQHVIGFLIFGRLVGIRRSI